jgi:hypothetical protein
MRVVQFLFLAAIFGWCFSTTQVVGNDTAGLAQTPADSIIVSNSPTGEDKDFFEVISKEGNPVSLKVFDRFGTLVFSTEAKKCVWDGRLSSGEKINGVYFYIAEVSGVLPKITEKGTISFRKYSPKNE